MIEATRRSVLRATELWRPLEEVAVAVRRSATTAEVRVVEADGSRRGGKSRPLDPSTEAALLNGVLHAGLLPDRGALAPGEVPFPVPLFVPMRTRRPGTRRGPWSTQVLPLRATIDGLPLGECGVLPTVAPGARRTVVLSRPPSRHKDLEGGSLTITVGFGRVPAPVLTWTDGRERERTAVLRTGAPLPAGAPSWAAHVRLRGGLGRQTSRDLSLCFAVTRELGDRSMARLLAQLKPLVAGRLRNHHLRNEEIVRLGGLPSSIDDRSNDLFECLVHQIRNYVDKARREEGGYVRQLIGYVLACLKPAVLRSELAYLPRTGHQTREGESANVSELVAGLRNHATIHGLTDPAEARAHHAVHWVLARHLRRELRDGELSVADLWSLWERGQLPAGVSVPELSAWRTAIGHQGEHVPLGVGPDDDADAGGPAAEALQLTGGEGPVTVHEPEEADLGALVRPAHDAGFFALTSRVAARLAAEEPEVWAEAVGQDRGVPVLLRRVLEPFAPDRCDEQGAERLWATCTAGGRWRPADELVAEWERARRAQADGPAGSGSTSTETSSAFVGPAV